jgi:peptide chain release factor 2
MDELTKTNIEFSSVNSLINNYNDIDGSINTNLELLQEYKEDIDKDILDDIVNNYEDINNKLNELEINTLLDGEFDSYNCYLEIHPGAGGTEAMDWASMLLRMYQMYFDKKGYKYEVVDYQAGDEAGVKSVMLHITNPYAYGYLKSEIGVHRLVRISPFNAAGKRQTSFAAVNVTPEIDDIPKDIEVNEEDIRWDITRASGNGGQGVNTTDSAVRLSHIPTGIVIYAQQERSQLRNKETAMKILKSKLYQLEVEKRNNAINSLKGSDDINFGSQIRNYVLEPYKLVKDLRTNYETSQADKVLDGDIDAFIEAYLRMKRD